MFKSIIAAAAITFVAASLTPTFADDAAAMKCDDASMTKMNDMMKAATDPKMKDAVDSATKHMTMANDAMKANKMDDCTAQIGMAMKDMSPK